MNIMSVCFLKESKIFHLKFYLLLVFSLNVFAYDVSNTMDTSCSKLPQLPNTFFITAGPDFNLGIQGYGLNIGATSSKNRLASTIRFLYCAPHRKYSPYGKQESKELSLMVEFRPRKNHFINMW